MGFWRSTFGFRTIPTTILLVLIYAAVFSTVLVTDQLPDVPEDTGGLDFDGAYADLHQIAARPHPYNSHSNELVHSYVLSRLQQIASRYPHVQVSEDLVSNASWAVARSPKKQYGVYFEGTNILVKIDGSEPHTGGVLFSAHYDSVSTAPGATDDGMGIATLIQMVDYLGKRRPKKTAVFNFNNGEEDGLFGAYAFLVHPWSNLTDTFLNLEGAAAGGRPMLFRGTSKAPILSFLNSNVPHPHANVISADGFTRGLVPSSTDYGIYASKMEGLDFAFYKGRSMYHTKEDSIPGTVGGGRALWAMMEAVRGAGSALVNNDAPGRGEDAVYFDLFAAVLIVFTMKTLFTINIVLLAAGPVLLTMFLYAKHVVIHRHIHWEELPEATFWNSFKSFAWLGDLWRLAKFWLAVALGAGLQVLLVLGYVNLNPYIVYAHPYLVLASTLSLAYLSTVLILNLPVPMRHALPEQQKHAVILQTYVLTWLLLLGSTIVLAKLKIGGVYLISAWNAVVLLGSIVGCLEGITGAKSLSKQSVEIEEGIDEGGIIPDSTDAEHEADATEETPLIRSHRRSLGKAAEKGDEDDCAIGWWILQLLFVVPAPVILVSHVGVFTMGALSQTLADGSDPAIVYAITSLVSFAVILPLAPFSFKVHRYLTLVVLVTFLASTAYNALAFPFSKDAPLKVYFAQKLEFDLGNGTLLRDVTTLMGAPQYVDSHIIPQFPSAWGKQRACTPHKRGVACAWAGGLLPSPGANTPATVAARPRAQAWLSVNATRTGAASARVSIAGTNTRACRLFWDSAPLTAFHVHGSAGALVPGRGIPPASGIQSVRLWSRTWDRAFVVDVEWRPRGDGVQPQEQVQEQRGRVACEWVEYESATAGSGRGNSGGRIPAYEEVLAFLPKWAVVTNGADGLVEAWGAFSV